MYLLLYVPGGFIMFSTEELKEQVQSEIDRLNKSLETYQDTLKEIDRLNGVMAALDGKITVSKTGKKGVPKGTIRGTNWSSRITRALKTFKESKNSEDKKALDQRITEAKSDGYDIKLHKEFKELKKTFPSL